MKENVLISIVISTRNKPWRIISKCLESIFSLNSSNDFEVILIDQNNDVKIEIEIKNDPNYSNILYLKSKEIGLSKGRNLGLRHTKGKWILFLDDDAILSKCFLTKIEKTLIEYQDEEIVFYGNVLNLEDNSSYLKRSIRTPYLHLWNFDSICSIGLLFNRKVIEKVGFFDENFGVGSNFGAGEESDMVIRTLQKGIRIKYLEGFIIYHPKARDDLEKKYLYGYGVGALYKKHILSSSECFLVLVIKFILEIIARTILGTLFVFVDSRKSQLHFNYLKGFLKGFLSYVNE